MTYCLVNAPAGEEVDYPTVIAWLNEEYPDGWVIVQGRKADIGYCSSMLGLKAEDRLIPLFSEVDHSAKGDDPCRYCKHPRADHTTYARSACDHAMCVCLSFEEPQKL